MEEELLATIEKLAPAYSKADHNAVLPLDDVLSQLLQRSAESEGRESLGRSMAVERLASLIPDLSQHCPDLRGSLRDETSEGPVLTRSASLDAAALQPVLLLLRILRNLCAGVGFNQDCFRLCGAHDAVSTIADRLLVAHVQRHQVAGIEANAHSAASPLPPSMQSPSPSNPANSAATSPAMSTPPSAASSPSGAAAKANRAALFTRRSISSSKLSMPPPSLSVTPNSFGSPSSRPSSPFSGPQTQPSPAPSPSPMGAIPPRTPQFTSFPPVIYPPPDVQDVLRAVLQVLGNFATGSAANQQAVWDRCFPGTLVRLAAVREPEVQGPLCMVLYTCCREDKTHCEELCGNAEGAALLSSVLLAAGPVSAPVPFTDAGAAMSEGELLVRGGGEWLEFLADRLFLLGPHLPGLFPRLAQAKPGSQGPGGLVPEQATLLAVLLAAMSQQRGAEGGADRNPESGQGSDSQAAAGASVSCERAEEEGAEGETSSSRSQLGATPAARPAASGEVVAFLAETARGTANQVGSSLAGFQEGPPLPAPLPTGNAATDVLGYSLGLLRELTSRASQRGGADSGDVLQLALDLLRALPPPAGAGLGTGSGPEPGAGAAYPRASPYRGYRKDLVAVVANACYRNPANQNVVRHQGALPLVLQQCTLEEANPFLREWGILAVRNLLEGNEENQKEVADLELVGGADTPELRLAGLRVEVDQESGKPRLVNIGAADKK